MKSRSFALVVALLLGLAATAFADGLVDDEQSLSPSEKAVQRLKEAAFRINGVDGQWTTVAAMLRFKESERTTPGFLDQWQGLIIGEICTFMLNFTGSSDCTFQAVAHDGENTSYVSVKLKDLPKDALLKLRKQKSLRTVSVEESV